MSQNFFRMLPVLIAVTATAPARAGELAATALELSARGVQIYTCTEAPNGAVWKLKAPEATLRDAAGRIVARHFAGPTWQAADDSKVVGTPLVASPAPARGAIPWLVLNATAHDGAGLFAAVTYITRTRTMGGIAPATGCDAAAVGKEIRLPYKATYTFFTPA